MAHRSRWAAAALLAAAIGAAPARAEEPKKDAPAAPAKVSGAFLDGFVGSWNVSMTGMGTGSGVTRVRKAAGGTALLQETQVTVAGSTYHAVSVFRVAADGKGMRAWRMDTTGLSQPTAFEGSLAEDGFEVKNEGGTLKLSKGADGAYVAVLSRGGSPMFTSTYAKASKEIALETPNAPKDGLHAAMLGTWDVTGEWTAPGKDGAPAKVAVSGASTFSWTLGGGAMLHDTERTSAAGPGAALGLHTWPADGSTAKVHWFDAKQLEPRVAEGPLTATQWKGSGPMPDGKTMNLEWAKKGDGFEMRYLPDGKPAGVETYARKK